MVNAKFEKWAQSQGYDIAHDADLGYHDTTTREADKMWLLVSTRCAQIADEGVKMLNSRIKAEGAARVGMAIRDAFGLPRK